nr:phosphotransferase family protein [Actinomycetota bacterium]NIS33446.1 phosphotransferase family protein [Actinomycetota bacterium]NIT96898.1 phosphotransferase family protein [Actinomycetota bacterium]NIU20571.1 phosphotransferase family protein [Actinomycetota bacterium]NIU68338.1 phosphotransferase family protein [Actinomycetota bacterium]
TDRRHYGPALEQWFGRRFPDRADPTVTDIDIPVATGFSNETVLFAMAWTEEGVERSDRFVARIEPTGGALFPPQTPQCTVSVEVQHRAMEAVRDHGSAPVPELLGYEADPAVIGQPFFVMGFVDGRVPADQPRYSQEGFLVDEASPDERRRMVTSGLEAMAGVHAIDWRSAGLEWLDASGRSEPTTRVQLDLYRRSTRRELAGRPHPVLDAALDWLVANDPGDDRVGLSWGDSRLGNIIWRDYRPAAVVDWEACALSPTEADVGWWLMFDRMSFDDLGAERMEGFPTRDEMIDVYERASGREVRDPHYWEVFGAMRFCAIFIGLGDRMTNAGLVPPELDMAVANMVTQALADLLGIDNPTPSRI